MTLQRGIEELKKKKIIDDRLYDWTSASTELAAQIPELAETRKELPITNTHRYQRRP